MSTLAQITCISHPQIRLGTRLRPAPSLLRLSALLRHALATAATPRDPAHPNLLPLSIPSRCCHDLFRCQNIVRWRLGDDRNSVFFCQAHFERFWEAGHDVQDFVVERWRG